MRRYERMAQSGRQSAPRRSRKRPPADMPAGSFSISSQLFRDDHPYQSLIDQRLQKGNDVAVEGFWGHVMLLRKAVKNFADAARFGKHVPDFGPDLIEVKI